jgi:hypothetical protein
MANTVLIKRSGTANAVPLAGNLVAGELAINYADGKLYFLGSGNAVTQIAGNSTMSYTGNVTSGNLLTGGIVSATANITGGNVLTGGLVSSTGNILTAGNVIAGKVVTANDNIVINSTGAEGGQLVLTWAGINGLVAQGNSTWNLDTDAGNTFRLFYQNGVGATGVLIQANSTSNIVSFPSAAGVTATGNLTGGNILTAGVMSSTGNAIHGNILTVGQVSATGTITSAGATNSTAFAVGNSAVSNVALGMFPTAGTPGEYAIRDYSNVFTNMYFDVGIGGTVGGSFRFRSSNTFTTLANINSTGVTTPLAVSATGNVTGNYFIGNGSQLTGITASAGSSIINGTSNVVVAASGNVTVGVAGTAGVATFTTTGIIANSVSATSNGNATNFKVGDDAWLGDINLADTIGIRGQQNFANGYIVFGNADGTQLGRAGSGPLTYGGAFSAVGNVTGGNLLTAGLISSTGNITGGNIVGSTLSVTGTTTNIGISSGGITTGSALIQAGGRSSGSTGALLNLTGNSNPSGASAYLMNGQHTLSPQIDLSSWYGLLFLPTISTFSGNIGSMYNEFLRLDTSATGNANITNWFGSFVATPSFTVGSAPVVNTWVGYYVQDPNNAVVNPTTAYAFRSNVNRAANRWGAYFAGTANNYFAGNVGIGVLSAGNALDVSGNVYVTSGNVLTTGLMSATGNITGGNLLTAGLISATGNITGGNITTTGIMSALGNITTANNFVYANSTSVAKAYQTYNSATSSIDMVFL